MATESVDELDEVLRLYQTWLNKPEPGNFWEQVPEAKKLLDAYIARECARKVLEGQIKELEQLPLARLDEPDAHKSKKYRDAGKFITVVYAPKRLAELRAAIQEVGGGEKQ